MVFSPSAFPAHPGRQQLPECQPLHPTSCCQTLGPGPWWEGTGAEQRGLGAGEQKSIWHELSGRVCRGEGLSLGDIRTVGDWGRDGSCQRVCVCVLWIEIPFIWFWGKDINDLIISSSHLTNYLFYLEANYFTILWWFLPCIDMSQPWVYMYPPCWTSLPAPSPSHPSGLSQGTGPERPVSCIKPGLVI